MQKGFGLKQETSAKCPVHSKGIVLRYRDTLQWLLCLCIYGNSSPVPTAGSKPQLSPLNQHCSIITPSENRLALKQHLLLILA